MSFGYSVGDVIAIGQLAWKVYKSCKDAPESFANISMEVLSLHALLKEVEEALSDNLSTSRKNSLATIVTDCQAVLGDLQALVDKYESLGSGSKRTWDRMGWGLNDISELRARLTANIGMLTAFISTSQLMVEKKLDKFIEEFRSGKREGSVITVATVESLSLDDKQTWRAIRKEFEEIGISVAAFDANKSFILQWFQTALETGAFEETAMDNSSSTLHLGKVQSVDRDLAHVEKDIKIVAGISNTLGDSSPSPRLQQPPRRQVPRVLRLVSWALRYDTAFVEACKTGDLIKAELLLGRGANFEARPDILGHVIMASQCSTSNLERIVGWLLEKGADPNCYTIEYPLAPPLILAVEKGYAGIANHLLKHNADVNGKCYSRSANYLIRKANGNVQSHLWLERTALTAAVEECLEYAAHHYDLKFTKERDVFVDIVEILLRNGANVPTLSYDRQRFFTLCSILVQRRPKFAMLLEEKNIIIPPEFSNR